MAAAPPAGRAAHTPGEQRRNLGLRTPHAWLRAGDTRWLRRSRVCPPDARVGRHGGARLGPLSCHEGSERQIWISTVHLETHRVFRRAAFLTRWLHVMRAPDLEARVFSRVAF